MLSSKNLINGEWCESKENDGLKSYNPVNGELVSESPSSTISDLKNAIESARDAFNKDDWKENHILRCKVLYQLSDLTKKYINEIAKTLTLENGKTLSDSMMEVKISADLYEYYAGMARNIYGRTVTHNSKSLSLLIREPLGVAGVITPWNAPIILLARSLAPALAAGNTVVIKPASLTSGVTYEFIKLFNLIPDLPKGVINLVSGSGSKLGTELTKNSGVDIITFTGSTEVGKEIVRNSAENLTRLSLELGGKSPNIILKDADFETAIKGAITGACLSTAGQICYTGTRILVEKSVYEKFMNKIKTIIPKMSVGDGMKSDTNISPVISSGQLETVMDYIEYGKNNAKLLLGGNQMLEGEYKKGNFIEPTVFYDVPVESKISQEEIFGPVLSVFEFETEDQAIDIANNTVYGLAAAVWTNNINKAISLARKVNAGTVWINNYGKNYSAAESAGFKQSGIGTLRGLEGLNEFTQLKNVIIETE